jgi:hypothetical protein
MQRVRRIVNLFFKGGDANENIKPSNKERSDEKKVYYLLDLERTLENGIPVFWKKSRHGYSYSIEDAGLFPKELAEKIVKSDLNNRTIMININTIAEILNGDYQRV